MASVGASQLWPAHLHTCKAFMTHIIKHTCIWSDRGFFVFCFFPVQLSNGSFTLQHKYSHHIWRSVDRQYGHVYTHTNTQPLTITDTKPLLLLIPSPPAVKISPPSNPCRSAQSSVSAGSLEKTCRLVHSSAVSALTPTVHQ